MTGHVTPFPRLLDLTRLTSRVGRGAHTGVDRVELAYLKALLQLKSSVFGLIYIGPDTVVLDRSGMTALLDRVEGRVEWGPPSLASQLHRKATGVRRSVMSDVRRLAVFRCSNFGLSRCLKKVGEGLSYINVGHSNLKQSVFDAVHTVPRAKITVLVHDVIPLDYPHFQRTGTVEVFEERMKVVSQCADNVIYNSTYSQGRAEHYFKKWGRVPAGVVAHLGGEEPDLRSGGECASKSYFVTIGTIEPRKNHALLLKIWARMFESMQEDQIPNLYVIGNRGWRNDEVFEMLDAAPFMGRVVHELSGVDDDEMFGLLGQAKALLFPSLVEGFGLPLLEAAHLGVPILCMDLEVYREFLGDVPIYLNQNDPYGWETEIKKFMLNGHSNVQVGVHGNRSFQMPTWKDHFNLVLKVV